VRVWKIHRIVDIRLKAKYGVNPDWLKRVAPEYYHPTRLYDMRLFHDVIASSQSYEPLLNPIRFEQSKSNFKESLKPISNRPERISRIKKIISVPDDIIPGNTKAKTFEEQIARLLDIEKSVESYIEDDEVIIKQDILPLDREILQETLSYCLRRLIVGDFPRFDLKVGGWLDNPEGLNRLAAGIFFLYFAALKTRDKIDWKEIMKEDRQIPESNILNLRPDGPIAKNWQAQLEGIRRQINIMRYPPVIPVCAALSSINVPAHLTWKKIAEITKSTENVCYAYRNYLQVFLTERFFPSVSGMGLRYRYLIRPKGESREDFWNARTDVYDIESQGLITRSACFTPVDRKNRKKTFYQLFDVQQFLEPANSQGPSDTPYDQMNFTVDSDLFSFRMDLFDTTARDHPWIIEPWNEPSTPDNDSLWLKRESPFRMATTLTLKQVQLIGFLWAHQGSYDSRMRYLDLLSFCKSTVYNSINQLLESKLLSILYYPALELSGLNEILMFVILDHPVKKIEKIIEWLVGILPVVHIQRSTTGRDMVAYLHLPAKDWYWIRPSMSDEFQKRFKISTSGMIVQKQDSFFMTFPCRLFDARKQAWKDPWS
jgi:hypothetical protein